TPRPFRTPLLSSSSPPAPPPLTTLSLHDALPISPQAATTEQLWQAGFAATYGTELRTESEATIRSVYEADRRLTFGAQLGAVGRSEEHTSELQSQSNLVCRLLLEKKKKKKINKNVKKKKKKKKHKVNIKQNKKKTIIKTKKQLN